MKKKLVLFSAILADIILFNAAICLGFMTKFQGIPPWVNIEIYVRLFPLLILINLVSLGVFQLYRLDRDRFPFEICYNTFWSVTISWLLALLVILTARTFWFPNASISRWLIVHQWIWSLIFISGWRILYYRSERKQGAFISRVAIIGSGRVGKEIMLELNAYSQYEHQVVGFIDAEISVPEEKIELPVLGKITDLCKLVDQFKITELIIAVSGVTPVVLLKIINRCQGSNTRIKILPSLYEVTVGRITLQETAGIPLIELRSQPVTGTYLLMKRVIDIILSLLSLIILSPLFIVVAIMIKINSPGGSVLFRQQRVGKDGKIFVLRKFRTMVPNAESLTGPVLATANDPRVTKLGVILRKTRIDEFPQLINVLKGEMSLVGPRPERPEFVYNFGKTEPFYERRHLIYPGVTGLAQIHGRYDSSVENKLRYDLAYVYNISLMLDLKILFSTLWVVLSGKGAR
jgi:exopolysaccharide biosynthesis polyprenyl glycosylphosphotransferase